MNTFFSLSHFHNLVRVKPSAIHWALDTPSLARSLAEDRSDCVLG